MGRYRRGRRKVYTERRKLTPTFVVLLCTFVICAVIFCGYNLYPDYIYPFFYGHHENSTLDVEFIKSKDLSIHFLELGNQYTGDCTLIKAGNVEVLIDAGSKASSISTIKNYLDQYVLDGTIEYVIVTHAHEDHYAGFATPEKTLSLFDLYNVKTVIQFAQVTPETMERNIYANYLRELNELQTRCNTKVFNALECVEETNGAKSQYLLTENIVLEVLDHRYYREVASTENNHSVCCQVIQNNDKYYLFTGDLEKAGEESLVASNKQLTKVELYKAGHHGSKTSSHNVLLEVIQPKIVCVCCCAGSNEYTSTNENQFPTQDFIDRIAIYTEKVYVTTIYEEQKENKFASMNGNIVVFCNEYDLRPDVQCSNNAIILKKTKWFKQNRNCPTVWL